MLYECLGKVFLRRSKRDSAEALEGEILDGSIMSTWTSKPTIGYGFES